MQNWHTRNKRVVWADKSCNLVEKVIQIEKLVLFKTRCGCLVPGQNTGSFSHAG